MHYSELIYHRRSLGVATLNIRWLVCLCLIYAFKIESRFPYLYNYRPFFNPAQDPSALFNSGHFIVTVRCAAYCLGGETHEYGMPVATSVHRAHFNVQTFWGLRVIYLVAVVSTGAQSDTYNPPR